MPFRFGPMELIIVLVVVLIIFGVGRLPEIGGAMGKRLKNSDPPRKISLTKIRQPRRNSINSRL